MAKSSKKAAKADTAEIQTALASTAALAFLDALSLRLPTPLAGRDYRQCGCPAQVEANALQVYLQLLSTFIVELGYYDDLSAFADRVYDILMWFDGKEAKLSADHQGS
ncbi:hypothetical protein GQ600_15813 [Phytophthora cactorum]|nr:hypothetical protein GQ600_24489 [Phytophthora cactorum]KAF1789688.1 hypothetical protein GQ600_15813 [Phytophthora cactorum]